MKITLPDEIVAMLHDMEYDRQQSLIRAAKADPAKHRFTTVMAAGKPASYRYWNAGRDGRGVQVRHCYTIHRNAAGYFMAFRERVSKKTIRRDQFTASTSKRDVMDTARSRAEHAQSTTEETQS